MLLACPLSCCTWLVISVNGTITKKRAEDIEGLSTGKAVVSVGLMVKLYESLNERERSIPGLISFNHHHTFAQWR